MFVYVGLFWGELGMLLRARRSEELYEDFFL